MPDTQAPPAVSDAARRIADAMNLHAVAKACGWAVFALADGATDNTAYETYEDALRSGSWDRDRFLYLAIQPDGMPDVIAQRYLDYARMLRDAGARLPDPRDFNAGDHSFPYHVPPALRRDWVPQIRNLVNPR